MKLLVLTSEPLNAARLRQALPQGASPEEAEVMVVAPALQDSALRFWLSDADDAIARADEVRRQTLSELTAEGIPASADTGDSDPYEAIRDALQSFPAERIIVFSRQGEHQRYREAVDPEEASDRFGIPVDLAAV